MLFKAQSVELSYNFGGILPKTDSTAITYQKFLDEFSQDGNIMVLGVQSDEFFSIEHFNAWYRLGEDLKKIKVAPLDPIAEGVDSLTVIDSVFSVAHLYNLTKNDELRVFELRKLMQKLPQNQTELDSLYRGIKALPFYEGLLFNKDTEASLMMLFVNPRVFNAEERIGALEKIRARISKYESGHLDVKISGLPYIRTLVAQKVKRELGMFIGLAALVTALLLFFFFRSFRVVLYSILVVITGVIWSMGTMSLFGFKLTILMGLIPPLMIVIGIPNCVYLLNKYHQEFKLHGNKIKALSRVIQKIGNATFMTNCTTAIGFATFIFTSSAILREFGIIAALNILLVFFLSILLIPIIFSYQPEPKVRHINHLNRKWLYEVAEWLVVAVTKNRRTVYIATIILVVVGAIGLSKIKVTGYIVDDLPSNDPILVDLKFFETHFNGVMPLEILVDTKRPGGALNRGTLRRVEQFQKELESYDEVSKSLSIVDALKFAKQAFFNGIPSKYTLINNSEQRFITPYLKNSGTGGKELLTAFVDTAKQRVRITAQMADVGTIRMNEIVEELRPKIDSIFNPEQYKVTLTGTSVVFFKGTSYLVKNLFVSLCIAVLIIACIMAFLFRSWRMVLISFVPNLIPLLVTASIMGYFGIAIKPSTILVFSIAFGISVDDTIHFLAKYRQELKAYQWNIGSSVIRAVRETGVSMIYTSIILFFGFGVFTASEFGGTQALGILVSVTLLVAMLTNLVLLPSLLMSLDRYITTQAFKEPLMEIIDEEEDIELDDLVIRKENPEES
ncbi:efflux RND transporter permease subunit [Luteibaculum oceani]|nr:efflux RND transporter permease subunit [Luteibaculum oceani]